MRWPALQTAVLMAGLELAIASAFALPQHAEPAARRNLLETPVTLLADGLRTRGLLAVTNWPEVRGLERRLGRPMVRGGQILLELHADKPQDSDGWPALATADRIDPVAVGTDSWLAWVPLASLERLSLWPGLQRVRLPWPLRPLQGPVLSKGATLTGATARHCHGASGAGIQVAVIDEEWYGFGQALADQELLEVQGKAPYQGTDSAAWHGTGCAEIVADMAPGAQIWPLQAATLPELQFQVTKLIANDVRVISQSSGWTTGYSFGDGGGKACALATAAKKGGIAWAAAAGNEGGGHQWRGTWSDQDGDGWLEFAADDESNGFYAPGGYQVDLEMDWNAYPATAIDLDFYVCANQFGPCQELASSKSAQNGTQTPAEVIWFQSPKSGTYFLRVHAKGAVPAGLALRMVGQGSGPLQHQQQAGTIVDPAACADVVAVGAAEVQSWQGNAIAKYSAKGPTFDGRIKPDLVAPTAVDIAVAPELFEGTSAACPHVAGALALLIGQGAATPDQAVAQLLGQVETHGLVLPDTLHGRGWLALAGAAVGCLPETSDSAACKTSCGTAGQTECLAPCQQITCTPLTEPCTSPGDSDAAAATADAAQQDANLDNSGTDVPAAPKATPAATAPSATGCRAAPTGSGSMYIVILAIFLGVWPRRRSASKA